MWIAVAMLLWTFDIQKSDVTDKQSGQAFRYNASDTAFQGDVSICLSTSLILIL